MNNAMREIVERATVTIFKDEASDNKGRGFLVAGGYILTAAHCVPSSIDGQMALGDHYLIKIIAANGNQLTGEVVAVEPVSDIALIGMPDDQVFPDKASQFERFAESTAALHLCADEFPFGESFPIHVFTHEGAWITGMAAQWKQNAHTLHMETQPPIMGGTSGSAVFNDQGDVIGVVSTATDADIDSESSGTCSRPCQSLPVWAWQTIKASES
jgi:S1-C subfamily serine protease